MRTRIPAHQQILPARPEEVFGFFADARNLEAITPPFPRCVQVRGSYALWQHTHELEPHAQATPMRDVVRRDVERIFDYRAAASPSKMRLAPGSSPGESAR